MALIELVESVTWEINGLFIIEDSVHFQQLICIDAISSICLARTGESSHAGDPLHVSGWGNPSDGNNCDKIINFAKLIAQVL